MVRMSRARRSPSVPVRMSTPSLVALLALAVGASAAAAQPPSSGASAAPADCADRSARRTVVEAERAFARQALEAGAQAAFMANLDGASILFRPGPVPGRAFQAAHPIPDDAGTLRWSPVWSITASSDDLGVTSGPYEWRPARAGAPSGFGTFNSVWRRDAAGVWRVLFDVGAGGSGPVEVPACAPVATVEAPATPHVAPTDPDALAALLRADSTLGARFADAAAGLLAVATPGTRLVREQVGVRTGVDAARALVETVGGSVAATPIAGGVSAAGDLGYSYGRYALGAAERGHYLRVWRRGADGAWRLVLDVTNALPPAPPRPD